MTEDFSGRRYGRLLVLDRDFTKGNKHKRWNCRCDCGEELSVLSFHLVDNTSKSCGCFRSETVKAPINDRLGQVINNFTVTRYLEKSRWEITCTCGHKQIRRYDKIKASRCVCMIKTIKSKATRDEPENILGKVYGRLTVLEKVLNQDLSGRKRFKYRCSCVCGGVSTPSLQSLKSGRSRSCGCYAKELAQISVYKPVALTTEQFIADSQAIYGVERYNYSNVNYVNSDEKVNIVCNECNLSWWARPRLHKSSKGCPTCATSGYKTNIPGTLYILKSGNLTKIGITNREVNIRVAQLNAKRTDKFIVIDSYMFEDGSIARKLESELLSQLKLSYEMPKERFDGWRECFIGLETDWLKYKIKELLQTTKESMTDE